MGNNKKFDYINNWKKETFKRIEILLNKETDKDIIEHLEGKERQQYIKGLIRDDMKKKH